MTTPTCRLPSRRVLTTVTPCGIAAGGSQSSGRTIRAAPPSSAAATPPGAVAAPASRVSALFAGGTRVCAPASAA